MLTLKNYTKQKLNINKELLKVNLIIILIKKTKFRKIEKKAI